VERAAETGVPELPDRRQIDRLIRPLLVLGIRMASFLQNIAVPLALGAVAIVLVLGFWNMARAGSPNMSQTLMRMRVLLQFVAIVIVMITIWALGR
jgi:hypothetical protein